MTVLHSFFLMILLWYLVRIVMILEELTAANSIPQSRILYNRNWAFGIGESINFGIQVLENQYDEIMIILADQVQITPRDIQSLLDSCVGDAIICADYNGSRGVPAIFPKKYFEHLTDYREIQVLKLCCSAKILR